MSYIERGPVAGDPYYEAPAYAGDFDAEMSGWLTFAGLMFFLSGFWNALEGLIGFFRSTFFAGTPVFGSLAAWSGVWIGIGVLEMGAAYAIFSGRQWARWFGIVLVSASTFVHMLAIPIYPWWSLFVIAINIAIIYALAVRWRPAPA
jgi:hypothetical protein